MARVLVVQAGSLHHKNGGFLLKLRLIHQNSQQFADFISTHLCYTEQQQMHKGVDFAFLHTAKE